MSVSTQRLILACIVVAGFFALVWASLYLPLTGYQVELDDMLIGAAAVLVKDVVVYFFRRD